MRWNIQFVVHGNPVEDDAFWDRLESMSRKRSFYASTLSDLHPALLPLQLFDIRQCVVGPSHIAFLLEDGRVCRLQYYVSEEYQPKSSTSTNETSKESIRKSGERPPKMPRSTTSPWIVSASDLSSTASTLRKWGSHIGVIRSMSSHSPSYSTTTNSTQCRRRGGTDSGTPLNSTSAVRLVRTSQLRGRGLQSSLISGHRVIVPASHVPEELVNQVQGILQGKSRSIIVRELQRTSLDVNLAVNNLLSRDDEDNDDGDDNGSDYMPGEDLMSLLDSGVNPSDHGVYIDADILPEDILGYTLSRATRSLASSRTSNREGSYKESPERDPIIRLRSPRFLETRRFDADHDDLTHRDKSSNKDKDKDSKGGSTLPSIRLAEDIEWWMDGDEHIKFTYIGGMHSELSGVDNNGNLRQWRWKKRYPFHHPSNPNIHHPRTTLLGLESKKITHLASCALRSSAVTEDGGVCTWIDESVAHHAAMLEQPVTTCVDLDLIMTIGTEKWKKMWSKCLHVSSLYSALLTSSGDIYAWGVLPFHLRKKFLERAQSKIKKTLKNNTNNDEIKVGSMVHLNKCAMYQTGAIAINPNGGHPKVGRLLQPVWSLSETCPFKIIRRKLKKRKSSTREPKESSNKGEDHDTQPVYETDGNRERETVVKSTANTTSTTLGSTSRKRKYAETDTNKGKQGADIQVNLESYTEETQEYWNLQDVFFVEESQPLPAGKVMKIDGDMVAVLFNKPGKLVGEKMSRKSLLKNMRLLRKEDVRSFTMDAPPKMPECILKKPRKLQIAAGIHINSICATDVGIEAIEGGNNGTPVRYVTIDLSGKVEGDHLPTPSDMFFGGKEKISAGYRCSLYHHQQDSARLLLDENSCLYPLQRNENSGIRDPRWLNLSPIVTLDAGSHMFKKRSSADKDAVKKLTIYAMVFQTQRLMPALLHRSLETVRGILARSTDDNVQEMCEERCDGKRNILHVAVSLACPTKNESQSRKTNDESKSTRKEERRSSPSSFIVEPAPTSNPSSRILRDDERATPVHGNAISVVTRNEINGPRFMRDVMQQFATVLDGLPTRMRTVSTTSPLAGTAWQAPPLMSESFRMFPEVAMDTTTSVSSPAAIPTLTWPPDSVPELMQPPVSGGADSLLGLNLSTRMSSSPLDVGKQLTDVSMSQQLAPSPPHNFLVPFLKKRGSTADGLLILKELLNCEFLKPVLFKLLSQRDALGHTPFMSAVYHRGYPAAMAIFNAGITIAKSRTSGAQEKPSTSEKQDISQEEMYKENLMAMIYPSKSDLDANPLYLVCVNDTCSFTWTGAQHINQDIYECWTCGLTGTLCCCSECARICHSGHDCKLKKTSPTAYCDCWEKCACRSLIAGDFAARTDLLQKLLHETDLVDLVNSRGETLLQFLATTVARQSVEQRQHRSRGVSRNSSNTKTALSGGELSIPQHDLHPPTFCREAFLSLLQDWKSVRSTVLASYDKTLGPTSTHDAASVLLPEEELSLLSQTGTSRLDSFILSLIVKCNVMYLDMILETLINQMQKLGDSENIDKDQKVVHGLVRSLVRIFIVLSVSSGPDNSSSKLMGRSLSAVQPLKRIQRAFSALAPVAIRELSEMASALIDPVRLGIAVPMAQFGFLSSNSDIINSCETAFAKPPFHAKNPSAKRKHKPSLKKKKDGAKVATNRSRPYSSSTRRLLAREDTEHGRQQDDDAVDNRRRDTRSRAAAPQHIVENMFNVSVIRPDAAENVEAENVSVDQEFMPGDWENPENNDEDDEQDDNDADQDDNDAENDSFTDTPGNDQTDMDTQPAEEASESRDRADSAGSLNDVQSEGDLDIDDEDDVQDDGSDVDTDVGTDFSGDDNDDDEKDESETRPAWLFLHELIGSELNESNQEEETGDADEANDDTNAGRFSQESGAIGAEIPVEDDDDNASSQEEDAGINNQDGDEDEVTSQHDFALERTSARAPRSTLSSAPQSMRWALGNSRGDTAGKSSTHRRSPVYADPLRGRNTHSQMIGNDASSKQASSFSTATSNAQLARAFTICVRELAKLIATTWQGDHGMTTLSTFLELNYEDVHDLKNFADRTLSDTWKWLITIIDSTEAQLRYGQVLSLAGSPGTATTTAHSRNTISSLDRPGGVGVFTKSPYSRSARETDSNVARQDFLHYALSLMRGHAGEHGGYLPVVNVLSMKHIAYVLDALIFYMRETLPVSENDTKHKNSREKGTDTVQPSLNIGYCSTDEDEDVDPVTPAVLKGGEPLEGELPDELFSIAVSDVLVGGIIANAQRKVDPTSCNAHPQKSFFRRSESMTFLGCGESDPFSEPLAKTLPLADKPHLLQPNARKEELFGRSRNQLGGFEDESYFDPEIAGVGMGRLKHKMHLKFDKMRQRRTAEKKRKQQVGKEKMETEEIQKAQNKTSVITQSHAVENKVSAGLMATPNEQSMEVDSFQVEDADKKKRFCTFLPSTVDSLLARCRNTMELFTKVFLDDVGAEPGSILQELGGFEVREAKFRKDMEKLRNSQSGDLQLNVERDPHRLILDAFKQLNLHYRRRTDTSSIGSTSQPLMVMRVKVVFRNEPGEGSGVSRSFYTALCEALLSSDPLPPLNEMLALPDSSSSRRSSGVKKKDHDSERLGRPGGKKVNLRSYFMARYAMQSSSSPGKTSFSTMALAAPPFHRRGQNGGKRSEFDGYKRSLGERILLNVLAVNAKWPRKITGILLVQPISDLLMLLNNQAMLQASIQEAARYLSSINYEVEQDSADADEEASADTGNSTMTSQTESPQQKSANLTDDKKNENSESEGNDEDVEVDVSTFPLFYQPGKRGFYSPAAGPTSKKVKDGKDGVTKKTPGYEARLNAFRNVGRIIGLCLLQNELCPLPLNRHVLKALLGRKINWYDFAFFDPALFESMRFLLAESENEDSESLFDGLDLSFSADVLYQEGGGQVDLIPNGAEVAVTKHNVLDYVRRYAIYRMITCCHKYIEQMRDGLLDILPQSSLAGLSAEDLRLLLNGCGRVNVHTLISYTAFNDESGKSGSSADKLTEFKRWFWSVVSCMNHPARQELLYFWTGSPALPASEDGFQPLPTITIRPPDDQHLPTANTCISRLYVPLYSTRNILKKKLTLAIKTKNFGFV